MPFNFPYDMMFYIHVSYMYMYGRFHGQWWWNWWYVELRLIRNVWVSSNMRYKPIFGNKLIWDIITNCWMLGFLGFLCSDIPTWRMGINWSGLIKLWRITGRILGDHPWPMPSDRMQNPSWSVSMNSWGIWFIVGFTNGKPLDLEWFV